MKIKGFSLIEVLISILIFSLIILSFDSMGLFALKENNEAYYFSVAQHQLFSMTERLRTIQSDSDLKHHLKIWNEQNNQVLPYGKGYVASNFPTYAVTIFWGANTSRRTCPEVETGILKCLSLDVQI